ncbi:uncharacterized protein LOC111003602 [Pieris rapae]|uniref:uncharacterized protein LOC111003602 n=1 Tax=Pieris rapae TaxID=64459 RepID=UPI001E280ACA|nr:uncharacterized protein LOC111003602 [Pieris rapae]
MKSYVLASFIILLHEVYAEDFGESRIKRQVNSLPLVYPYGGTYKLVMGFSAPIPNSDKIPINLVVSFQYQYVQYANISELSRYYFIKEISREERDADLVVRRDERLVFYQSAIEALDSKGFNGEQCVYRALCEAAQHPVEDDGLFGEVVHILLTPDFGVTDFDEDPQWKETMEPYIDASVAGRQMYNCAFLYNKCPEGEGILEFISVLNVK